MLKIRAAIVGASGYSGEELLRLLRNHPAVEITCITSRQHAGKRIGAVFPRFAEWDLLFSEPDSDAISAEADAAFLALPHGVAASYAAPLLTRGLHVFDSSADFRLRSQDIYEKTYRTAHPAPELLRTAVYGLPERYRGQLENAQLVACPGCYPTSILLPLIPFLERGIIDRRQITVISLSGVTGAGRKVDLPYLFPECNESVRPYAVTGHRHLPEIEQELSAAASGPVAVSFIPHLVPVNRGIHSTILATPTDRIDEKAVHEILQQAYTEEPFVRVLTPPGCLADTKHVTYTNMCEIGGTVDSHTGRVILSSAIDNLTKGAAGQAVQCFNNVFGLEETAGLI